MDEEEYKRALEVREASQPFFKKFEHRMASAVIVGTDKSYDCPVHVCYSDFGDGEDFLGQKPIALIVSVQSEYDNRSSNRNYDRDVAIRFYDYLLNRSPLAPVYATKDPIDAIDNGIIGDTNHQFNYVHTAMVCVRATWEFPIARNWVRLVDNGMNENLAYALSHCLYIDKTNKITRAAYTHSGLSPFMTLQSVKNFVKGEIISKRRETYRENATYGEGHSLWGYLNYDGEVMGLVRRFNQVPNKATEYSGYNPFERREDALAYTEDNIKEFVKYIEEELK